jgi:tetratricopeptide (TPR) repeat protein
LVRETIYDDLGPVDRARVHLRLGEALEALAEDGTPRPGVLAHHWRHAAPLGDPAKAIQYTLQAAEAAYAAFGFEDAINLWESAHDLMRSHGAPPEQQARLLERLATGRFTAGLDVARGVTALEKALAIWEELGRGEEAARTHARLGQGLFFSDAMDITRALRHLQAARDVLEAGPSSPLLARLLAAEAGARLYSLELDRSADLSAQAMEPSFREPPWCSPGTSAPGSNCWTRRGRSPTDPVQC